MEENVFTDKSIVPDGRSVLRALGDAGSLWLELRRYIQENYGPAIEEWKYYGPRSGWTMKLVSPQKTLFAFTALRDAFRLVFVFAENELEVLERSDLPKNLVEEAKSAKKSPEGRRLQIEVKDRRCFTTAKMLTEIRAEN